MLQVTEEYVDGGYVYTVKDTDKYDAHMQEQLDTKATCLAEPDTMGSFDDIFSLDAESYIDPETGDTIVDGFNEDLTDEEIQMANESENLI